MGGEMLGLLSHACPAPSPDSIEQLWFNCTVSIRFSKGGNLGGEVFSNYVVITP